MSRIPSEGDQLLVSWRSDDAGPIVRPLTPDHVAAMVQEIIEGNMAAAIVVRVTARLTREGGPI